MTFFDESVVKKEEENKNKINSEMPNSYGVYNPNIQSNNELEINKKNREQYEELMKNSETKYDSYYDKNNVFVKLILFLLLVFIIIGVAYYVLLYLSK